MEPISALHIAGTALSAAKGAWDVGQALYTFVNDAKKIDKTMLSFAGEVQALGTACRTVGNRLERVVQEREANSPQDEDSGDERDDLWSCLNGQISQCQQTILELQEAVSCAKRDYQKESTFLNQAIRQIKLNMKTDDISQARSQIQSHISSLNVLLLAFAIDLTYVGPQRADRQLPAQIAELTTKRDVVEKHQAEHDANGAQSQERQADDVVKVATKIIHRAETLYAGSVAGGSVYGDVGPQKGSSLHGWMEDIHELDEIQAHELDDTNNDNDGPVSSDFSHQGKSSIYDWMSRTETIPEDESEISGSTPLTSSVFSSPLRVNPSRASDSVSSAPPLHPEKSDYFPPESNDNSDTHNEGDEDIDGDDDLLLEAFEEAMLSSREAFENRNYTETKSTLEETLRLVKDLPINKQAACDRYDVSFMLAVCEFHLQTPEYAEPALMHILENTPRAKVQNQKRRLQVCEAGHLLAQTYIKLGKIDKARIYCDSALQGHRRLLGKDNKTTLESMALMCRIMELEGRASRAKIYLKMIPMEQRAGLTAMFAKLGDSVATVEVDESEAGATPSSPQSPAPQTPQIERIPSLPSSPVRKPIAQPVGGLPSPPIVPAPNPEYVKQSKEYRNQALVELVKSKGYTKPKPADALTRQMWMDSFGISASSDLAKALLESRKTDALKLASKSNKVGAFMRRKFTKILPDLHLAALFGEVEVVQALIKKGNKPTLKQWGTTPLHCAAYGGYVDIAQLLIDSGSPVDPYTLYDGTPLMTAIILERLDVIDLLLHYGADPNTENEVYGSPVHCACAIDNPLLVEAVSSGSQALESVKRVDLQHIQYRKQILTTKDVKSPQQMPKLDESDADFVNETITQPLGVAAFFGSQAVLTYLIDKGLEINNKYTMIGSANSKSEGHTTVSLAAMNGQTDTVRYLIEHGGSISSTNSQDPLYYAAINGHQGCEDLLFEKGVTAVQPMLNQAVLKGDQDRLRKYLSHNPSVQLLCDTLLSAIRYKLLDYEGAEECLDILKAHGAAVDSGTAEDGYNSGTLLHVAIRIDHSRSVTWLLANGAQTDIVDSKGWTPLMLATQKEQVENVKQLLSYNASRDGRNKSGKTAYDYALAAYNEEILELFQT